MIYAVFRQKNDAGPATLVANSFTRSPIDMLRTLKIAAATAALVFATAFGVANAADTVTADDTARFLAGMLPSAESPLMPLTKDPVWQRHARFFDSAFAQLEQRQMAKVRAWSDANLAAPKPTMFYMFSGPDSSTPTRSIPRRPPMF